MYLWGFGDYCNLPRNPHHGAGGRPGIPSSVSVLYSAILFRENKIKKSIKNQLSHKISITFYTTTYYGCAFNSNRLFFSYSSVVATSSSGPGGFWASRCRLFPLPGDDKILMTTQKAAICSAVAEKLSNSYE